MVAFGTPVRSLISECLRLASLRSTRTLCLLGVSDSVLGLSCDNILLGVVKFGGAVKLSEKSRYF